MTSLLSGSVKASVILDEYKTSNKTLILGAVVGSGPEHFILDYKKEGYEHHGFATAIQTVVVIDSLKRDGDLPIGCVCTDDAGQCGRAGRILVLRYPKLALLRRLAHQVNHLMKHVLKDWSLLLTAERAFAATNLLARSSAKLLPQATASLHRT